jgi:enamine deaminase RidA (YjgF/YER057c/UK114 family)
MNQVYVTYFSDHLPARSAMGVNGLARGARLEIKVIAVVK